MAPCFRYFKSFHRSKKQGQGTVEMVMSMLLFTAMIGALVSLSLYLYINHSFLTAAKEGARVAAADSNFANTATINTGITNVRNWVRTFVSNSTGIQLSNSNINVTGPTGSSTGNRRMTVTITYQFQNPVQIRTFLNRLSGGSATGLDTFTITNTATMRYEE
jgi:Flp pilus assembly protein TadG